MAMTRAQRRVAARQRARRAAPPPIDEVTREPLGCEIAQDRTIGSLTIATGHVAALFAPSDLARAFVQNRK